MSLNLHLLKYQVIVKTVFALFVVNKVLVYTVNAQLL